MPYMPLHPPHRADDYSQNYNYIQIMEFVPKRIPVLAEFHPGIAKNVTPNKRAQK